MIVVTVVVPQLHFAYDFDVVGLTHAAQPNPTAAYIIVTWQGMHEPDHIHGEQQRVGR